MNHLEFTRGIITKTGLVNSLQRYYMFNKDAARVKYTTFESVPYSMVLKKDIMKEDIYRFLTIVK